MNKMSRKDVFAKVESWVIMCALENFPADQVWDWTWPQWLDFYERIEKGLTKRPGVKRP